MRENLLEGAMRNSGCTTTTITVALLLGVSSAAVGQNAMSIANNDSVFIDGRNHSLTRGTSKADISAEIKRLGAREMGPATLIIRSGGKLYILDNQMAGSMASAADPRVTTGYDPARGISAYVTDPRVTTGYDPARGVSAYATDPRVTTGYDPARGVSAYATDPRVTTGYDPARGVSAYAVPPDPGQNPRILINDPDYVYFKLRKAFDDNWVTGEPRQ
jgi:hypothetical protein